MMENNSSQGQNGRRKHPASEPEAQHEKDGSMKTQNEAGGDQQRTGVVRSDDPDTLSELEKKHGRDNHTRKGNSSIAEE